VLGSFGHEEKKENWEGVSLDECAYTTENPMLHEMRHLGCGYGPKTLMALKH